MKVPTSTTAEDAPRPQGVLRRWPSALGLAVAALQLALGTDTETVATVIGVAVLCYLGAAALDRRWVAWAGCVVFSLVVVASQAIGVAWWAASGIVALALVVAAHALLAAASARRRRAGRRRCEVVAVLRAVAGHWRRWFGEANTLHQAE